MRFALCSLLLAASAMVADAQSANLPDDIDSSSLSRFPTVERSEMTSDTERATYDYIVGTRPRQEPLRGPGGISLHSPGSAEPI